MDAERNLLFGVLALQADLIDAVQFAEVCTAWATRKDRLLADLLRERGWITTADQADVERLLERKLRKHGDARASLAAAVAVTGDAVRRPLAALDDADLQRTITGLAHTALPGSVQIPPIALTRGRYTLTGVHATGGLGRVWLARDDALGREVALKELLPEGASHPFLADRFLEEARVTGQLEHPGIVPVYELARRPEDQQPFYTMRFVRGRTLSETVRAYHSKRSADEAGPFELRALVQAFVAVCNTVAFAHARGVLHRDLKGENVVLGDFGEVIVLDWGLAKVLGRADEEDGPTPRMPEPSAERQATVQGQVLGTPAYMAPEQAAGELDRIDQRTDVYGLGAILYEMLTGRPPFTGADTQEVLRRVQQDEPVRPRRACAEVAPALEAVCLRALAKDPVDRYAAATDLAQDVQRWLADEPVSAYRESLTLRLGRWARRHKPLVASAAALLVTISAALSISTVLIAHQQQQTDLARREELEQRQAAQQNFEMACKAVDGLLTEVGQNRLRDLPWMEEVRGELLHKALTFYQDFLRQRGDDPRLRLETARAHQRVGGILRLLGQTPDAGKAYRTALDLLKQLTAEDPGSPAYRQALAAAHHDFSILLGTTAQPGADRETGRAVEILTRLVDAYPRQPEYQEALAECSQHLGLLHLRASRRDEAERHFRRAVAIATQLTNEFPENLEHWRTLANCQNSLGSALLADNKPAQTVEVLRHVLAVRHRVAADPRARPGDRRMLAGTYSNLGGMLATLNQPSEAKDALHRGVDLFRKLTTEFRSRPDYEHDLAVCYFNLGALFQRTSKPTEAAEAFREAVRLRLKLADDFPANPVYQDQAGRTLQTLALHLRRHEHATDAVALLEKAIPRLQAALKARPKNTQYRQSLCDAHGELAETFLRLGKHSEAAVVMAARTPLFSTRWQDSYQSALLLARCAALAEKDGRLEEEKRTELTQSYGAQAVLLLRESARKGFTEAARLKEDEYLAPLRRRDDFKKLLAELEK